MKTWVIGAAILMAVLFGGLYFTSTQNKPASEKDTSSEVKTSMENISSESARKLIPPTGNLDTKKSYSAVLKTTEGEITIEFKAKQTPKTVENFINLAKKDFYNNTIFHRVIKGFMIQGGDPQGSGSGGPGYRFEDEDFEGEYTKGTVAMANAGPDTNGSQFFIMHAEAALPKNYVIFGKVTKGLEVVDRIASAPVSMSESGENSKPVSPVKITSIEMVEK